MIINGIIKITKANLTHFQINPLRIITLKLRYNIVSLHYKAATKHEKVSIQITYELKKALIRSNTDDIVSRL